MNKTSGSFESVKKILNGGGGLSLELVKDAIRLFPRATLVSAYGVFSNLQYQICSHDIYYIN